MTTKVSLENNKIAPNYVEPEKEKSSAAAEVVQTNLAQQNSDNLATKDYCPSSRAPGYIPAAQQERTLGLKIEQGMSANKFFLFATAFQMKEAVLAAEKNHSLTPARYGRLAPRKWKALTSEALYHLAHCYDRGYVVNQNKEKAMQCYRKAAEAGHAGAKAEIEARA